MSTTFSIIYGGVITLLITISGFLAKNALGNVKNEIKNHMTILMCIQKELSDLRVEIAKEYVKTEDLNRCEDLNRTAHSELRKEIRGVV